MLKVRIQSLDEAPASIRDEYQLQDDGTFLLDLDHAVTDEQINGLKSALAKQKQMRVDAEKKVRELEEAFHEIDPEKYREWERIIEDLGDKKLIDTEGLESAVTKRTENLIKVHEREKQQIQQALDDAKRQVDEYLSKWQRDRIETRHQEAAMRAGIDAKAVQDMIRRAREEAKLDENGDIFYTDAHGEPLVGNDGIRNLSVDEWMLERKKDTNWFGVTSGGGPHHRDVTLPASLNLENMSPAQRLTAIRSARKQKVV